MPVLLKSHFFNRQFELQKQIYTAAYYHALWTIISVPLLYYIVQIITEFIFIDGDKHRYVKGEVFKV